MGHGSYSTVARSLRATAVGYDTQSAQEIFKQKDINNAMTPFGLEIRESRDSVEHPNSLAIIIALDVTGSMGSVPYYLVKEGLPTIVQMIIDAGFPDPQILFLGIGDHECDRAPIQVGQFESSDELMDKWLTTIWLEGGGGGNLGESYHLAWYVGANYTDIDCFKKRGQKGFLFTIGDEPVLSSLPIGAIKSMFGPGQYATYSAEALLDAAAELYHTYHIHIKSTRSGQRQTVIDGWHQLFSDNLLIANHKEDVIALIAKTVVDNVVQMATPVEAQKGIIPEEEIIL